MTSFSAHATGFELHPQSGEAFEHLNPLFARIARVDFVLTVNDPTVNQGQMVSTFDPQLEQALHTVGALQHEFLLPPSISQELDFAFAFNRHTVAVEIEKANREKILRDFLKCHMYLRAGADFAVVILPKNYPHKLGTWNLFDFGVQRFNECLTYGFGTPENFGRIVLVGYNQFETASGAALSMATRQRMRVEAASKSLQP